VDLPAPRAHEEKEVAFGYDKVHIPKGLGARGIGLPDVLEADDWPAVKIWC